MAALADHPARRAPRARESRRSTSSSRRTGMWSTSSTWSTTARPPGSRSEPGEAETLVPYLEKMRFMLRVEVADVSADYAVVGEPVAQRHPSTVIRRTSSRTRVRRPSRPTTRRRGSTSPCARTSSWSAARSIVPRAELAGVRRRPSAGCGHVGLGGAPRRRRRAARLGYETDHRTIPQEVGWVPSAVHLDKGCYRGQETVARVHNLGAAAEAPRAAAPRRQRLPHSRSRAIPCSSTVA